MLIGGTAVMVSRFSPFSNFEDSHESRLHQRQPLITDPTKVSVPAYLPDNAETRSDLAQYYDCVTRADTALGRILAQLAATASQKIRLSSTTAITAAPSPRSKRFLYDNGSNPPLVVHFPKK